MPEEEGAQRCDLVVARPPARCGVTEVPVDGGLDRTTCKGSDVLALILAAAGEKSPVTPNSAVPPENTPEVKTIASVRAVEHRAILQ
ncbi:hypothetical protein GN956_G930 [Arapaima gigas]